MHHYIQVSDKGSNMVKGWEGFEGGVCAMHTGERSVAAFLQHELVGLTHTMLINNTNKSC